MAHPARLSLRAPPHLPFIQGFPGIPGSSTRPPPAVCGTVEVRIGPVPVKAKWVRIEIRKHELLPSGFPSAGSGGDTWEHVGEIIDLWKAPAGREFGELETADFKFRLNLPETIPPTLDMIKGGIQYELVAALCYRNKGGLFKKESSNIMKISETIRITKHELHSAWPIYNAPDTRTISDASKAVQLTVQRPSSAFGPSDRILFTASLRSSRPQPFKLKGFECTLYEVITATAPPPDKHSTKSKKHKGPTAPVVKSRVVAAARAAVDESVGRGGEKSARMELAIPAEKLVMTVRNAKVMEVGYELEVKAVCDGVPELRMSGIRYTVGPFTRAGAQQAVRDIGYVESLCPTPPGGGPGLFPGSPPRLDSSAQSRQSTQPNSLASSPGLPNGAPSFATNAQSRQGNSPYQQGQIQPTQGFVPRGEEWRRKSSGTSITTTTTATTAPGPDFAPQAGAGGRYATAPNRNSVAFPAPQPAGGLRRSASQAYSTDTSLQDPTSPVSDVQERMAQSDMGHGEDRDRDRSYRYSSATAATFGRWEGNLRAAPEEDEGTTSSYPATPVDQASNPAARTPSPYQATRAAEAGTSNPKQPAKTPPSAWPSAEQEKLRLYNQARNRAAASQQAGGASLDRLGMDDIPAAPPPEYAPPRPIKPAGEAYTPPARPVSEYFPAAGSDRDRSTSPGVGSSDRPPPPRKPAVPEVYLSAAEEKEQQRHRYEAAHRRVTSGAGSSLGHESPQASASASASASRSAATSPVPGQSPQRLTNAAVPNGNVSDAPVPYEAIFPSGSSSSRAAATRAPVTPAVDEKEQMRRYYEARDRVDRTQRQQGSSAQGSAPELASPLASPDFVPPATSSTTINAVGSGSGSGSGSGPSGSVGPPKPANGAYMSAAEEKEMMRKRFEEASARVANAQRLGSPTPLDSPAVPRSSTPSSPAPGPRASGSGSGMASGSGSGGGASSVPAAYMSAGDEKEMMRRRYEDASSRVARTQGLSSPPPMDSPVLPRASKPLSPAPTASGSGSGGVGSAVPAAYLSAAEEKEMMRKRYEDASSRVARTQGSSSSGPNLGSPVRAAFAAGPGGPGPGPGPGSGSGSGSAPTLPPFAPGPANGSYMSATEEKEAMRRRYEDATTRVARASASSPPASPSPSKSTPYGSSGPSGPSGPSISTPNAAPAPAFEARANTPAAYPPAADEKELMRRRYDDATASVSRAQGLGPGVGLGINSATGAGAVGGSSNLIAEGSGSASTSHVSPPPSAFSHQQSSSAATSPPESPVRPAAAGGAAGMGKGKASQAQAGQGEGQTQGPIAPPPPLPARPPADYINLLSPVGR